MTLSWWDIWKRRRGKLTIKKAKPALYWINPRTGAVSRKFDGGNWEDTGEPMQEVHFPNSPKADPLDEKRVDEILHSQTAPRPMTMTPEKEAQFLKDQDEWRRTGVPPKPLGTTVAETRVPVEETYLNMDDAAPSEQEWAEAAAAQGEWQDLEEVKDEYTRGYLRGVKSMAAKMPDPRHSVVNPPYYKEKIIEPIDVIEDWDLPHHLACVVKYLARWDIKDDATENLGKAQWYLDRFLSRLENFSSGLSKGTGTPSGVHYDKHPCPGCGHPDNMECVQHRMQTGTHIRSASGGTTNLTEPSGLDEDQ